MDHQKNSLPSSTNINFAANPFPSQFAGLNSVPGTNNVVSSPLFMSSLQQLSSGAAGFLPSSNQLGSSWNAQCQQTASWIDQANKMAAMLPMYNALQTAVNASDPTYMQQNLKNQAAVVAAAACMPNPLLFASSHSLSAAVTQASTASMSPCNTSDQAKPSNNRRAWNGSSPVASCSQSASTSSQPRSNEGMESPLNYTTTRPKAAVNEGNGIKAGAGHLASTRLSNASVEELSALELHDFGDYLIERAKEVGGNVSFPASFFAVEDSLLPSTSKNIEQRSSSCETKPSSSSMRSHESIHDEQQAEELANADFELDRLVSLVARQNDANIIAPLPSTSSSLFSMDAFKTPERGDKQLHLLNPPQFTPPDSPTNLEPKHSSSAILSLSSQPFVFSSPNQSGAKTSCTPPSSSTSLQSDTPVEGIKSAGLSLMFLPKVSPTTKSPVKSASAIGGGRVTAGLTASARPARVPIYKSGKSSMFTVKELAGPSISFSQHKPDDAFSFTDDEDEEPEAAILSQASSSKPANTHKSGVQSVYVPANSNENESELLKHVVPKKRHLVHKNVAEDVAADPASSVQSCLAEDGANPQNPQTSSAASSLAQLIRSRRTKRKSSFLRSEFVEDNDCVCLNERPDRPVSVDPLPLATCSIKLEEPDEGEMVRSKESPRPSLPKLVIKLLAAKKEPEESMQDEYVEMSKKEKKKRKKKDKDKDWMMSGQERSKKENRHHKKKKHKKHKKEKRRKSLDAEYEHTSSSDHLDSASFFRISSSAADNNWESGLYSKKHRLISQWNGSGETPSTANDDNFVSARPKSKCDTSFVAERLKCLSRADGRSLSKGTFLVVKEEAFKPDCPLWKVDNQNLLQKYLPILHNQAVSEDSSVQEILSYKNSSTYAGWCEQIAEEYLVVEIRYVKHSRSENIIKPVIPISDLIPAVSSEIAGQSVVRTDEELRREKTFANDELRFAAGDNGLKTHLHTLLQALLNHAVTLNFLQTVKSTNDWNFLCALDEFDQRNAKACQKVYNQTKWLDQFQTSLHTYSDLCIVDGDHLLAGTCQACANSDTSAIVQLFTNETYNRDILLVNETDGCDSAKTSTLPAVEFLVCSGCKLASKVYHVIYHMKYHIFKLAEEKLEAVCEENPELTAEAAVQLCLNNKSWVQNSLNNYMDFCRKADEVFS